MIVFQNNKAYTEYQFDKEADFEREIVKHSKNFFGNRTIYIDVKKKIETKTLGNTIPDGYLFDLTDPDNPEFYIVEVELAVHDFFRHIFPQITRFIGFYKNNSSVSELVGKLHTIINNDAELNSEFRKLLGNKEIYKFIKDTVESSQYILLILDREKKEMQEIMDTYTETWGKMVRPMLIKKFANGTESIYTIHPELESIDFYEPDVTEGNTEDELNDVKVQIQYTEEHHLEGVSDNVKEIYQRIKTELLQVNPELVFNPQKYYLSIRLHSNLFYLQFRRKKLTMVIRLPYEQVKIDVKIAHVRRLSNGVQRFYNGAACAVVIENQEQLTEVLALMKRMVLPF